jgi:hypothetical protein
MTIGPCLLVIATDFTGPFTTGGFGTGDETGAVPPPDADVLDRLPADVAEKLKKK